MESPIESLLDQARQAQRKLLVRARALKNLVEMSEDGRRARARQVLEGGGVRWVRPGDEGEGSLKALVAGRGKQAPQLYSVHLQIRGDQAHSYHCDCHDHGRVGACKHVLAVAGAEILRIRADWKRLKGAIEALEEAQ